MNGTKYISTLRNIPDCFGYNNEIADDIFILETTYRHSGVSSDEERETYSNRFLARLLFSSMMGGVEKMRVSRTF